jgi:hypothetical protein
VVFCFSKKPVYWHNIFHGEVQFERLYISLSRNLVLTSSWEIWNLVQCFYYNLLKLGTRTVTLGFSTPQNTSEILRYRTNFVCTPPDGNVSKENELQRNVLSLNPLVAPVKVGVIPHGAAIDPKKAKELAQALCEEGYVVYLSIFGRCFDPKRLFWSRVAKVISQLRSIFSRQ